MQELQKIEDFYSTNQTDRSFKPQLDFSIYNLEHVKES